MMDVDGAAGGLATHTEELDEDDAEFKTWKQVTKKDRAMAATERNRLFRGDHINPEEPALLRSKAGMRRWLRQQKQYMSDQANLQPNADAAYAEPEVSTAGETLAEGIEKDQDRTLPDYYDVLTAIPNLNDQLKWTEDSEGKVIPQTEEYLRLFPKDQFTSTESVLTKRIEANMRQMQDTRKICAKIGIVKQMQIQAQVGLNLRMKEWKRWKLINSQTYQNQFQKYDPEPFVEQDVGALAVSEDGPIMSPWVCRAAFQRSVGKIFYHAGFEDFQPSALDTATDIAADFFSKLIRTFTAYAETPKVETPSSGLTAEEQVLHSLHKNGLDLEGLESYVKDDVERLSGKLSVVHDRMKAHLADLLVSHLVIAYPGVHQLTLTSVRLWVTALDKMASVPSTMAASNLWAVTLRKILMKTSSASKNLDWLTNSASKVSVFLCICYRIGCIVSIKQATPFPSLRLALCSSRQHPTSRLLRTIYRHRSGWFKTSLLRNWLPTKVERLWKMKTFLRSSASRNRVYHQLAKSLRPENVHCESNNRWRRRSGSSRNTKMRAGRS